MLKGSNWLLGAIAISLMLTVANEDARAQELESRLIQGIIKDDFLVNTDSVARGTYQYQSDVAVDSAGNFVIVWEDVRNGKVDIYMQQYNSSGLPIGANTKVSNDGGNHYNYDPSVSMLPSGSFVVVWKHGYQVYLQRYDNQGSPIGDNQTVLDDGVLVMQYEPTVAVCKDGSFVVAWGEEYRDMTFQSDIYMQRFDANGNKIGLNFRVNDIVTGDQQRPSIQCDQSSRYVVTWYDTRNGNSDIYFQMYDSDGSVIGANSLVNDDLGTASQYAPVVAISYASSFVIAWDDLRNGNQDVYYQRFSSNGSKMGTNMIVNDDGGTTIQTTPSIAIDSAGNFLIVWTDYRAEMSLNYDVYCQYYSSDGSPVNSNFLIRDAAAAGLGQSSPAISSNNEGNMVVSWRDTRDGFTDQNIYAQRIYPPPTLIGSNFRVSQDQGAVNQTDPSVAMDTAGNFTIIWSDRRNDHSDIYLQRCSPSGEAIGDNVRVNDYPDTASQNSPAIAMAANGLIVTAWGDARNGNYDIFYQRFDAGGSPIGSNMRANSDVGSATQRKPAVAFDSVGNFAIAWVDYRNQSPFTDVDIYWQLYDNVGNPIGGNRLANTVIGKVITTDQIGLAMSSDRHVIITWRDARNGPPADIMFQEYRRPVDTLTDTSTSAIVTVGSNTVVNDASASFDRTDPSISMAADGRFVISWVDERVRMLSDIYCQFYGSNSLPEGSNLLVSSLVDSVDCEEPNVSMNDIGQAVITWTFEDPNIENPTILGQRFDQTGNPIGENFLIVQDGPNYGEESPAVTCNENRIAIVWQDNRRSMLWDIYAKVVSWDWEGIITDVEDSRVAIPSKYVLLQNYPNPFNPTTTIMFDLPRRQHVTLSVYNILGQQVREIVNADLPAGSHRVEWDGTSKEGNRAASGVYFYRIVTDDFIGSKKMILLK